MSRDHNTHVVDGTSLDVREGETPEAARDRLLELIKDLPSSYPDPVVETFEGVRVVRDDLIVGTKCRGGELLLRSELGQKFKRVGYVQTRVGLAGPSILEVAKNTGHEVHLFMPACHKVSYHQACCIEQGAVPHFMRVVAMPNLNRAAARWSEENAVLMLPPGLRHQVVSAGVLRAAMTIPEPEVVYVATSTGVLTRALQLAWPKAIFVSVCVARNMKAGELGRANPLSEPLPFTSPERKENLPPFPSIRTYDAKVWKHVPKNTGADVLFWNVGREPQLLDDGIYERVDSKREWKEALR